MQQYTSMVEATFRFYEELNDFLPMARRRQAFRCPCARRATTKHMIEALGVPHTEVELILVNNESVDFGHVIEDGDRIAVYPKFESLDIRPLLRVREEPLRKTRFVADVHLGGLARLLRMAGFDTLYRTDLDDEEIAAIASTEQRIVLTRDRELLKRRTVTHGCYIRELKSSLQFAELFKRLDLSSSVRPFTRCMQCNRELHDIDPVVAGKRVPPQVALQYTDFRHCGHCDRIYWKGSHWRAMQEVLDTVLHS